MARDRFYLLRGLTREAAHWDGFEAALAAAVPGADVRPLELPGAGALHAAQWPGDIAAALEEVRAQAAPGGRAFVLGLSLGGMVAMEWAARYPGELAGIVVGASSAGDLSRPWQRMRVGALPAILGGRLRRDLAAREAAVVRVVTNRAERWDTLATRWTAIARARPVSIAAARGQLAAALRWRAPARLAVPALFLAGTTDRLVDVECSRALARRFVAPLVEHPTAGHDLTSDEPGWVAEQVARWRRGI